MKSIYTLMIIVLTCIYCSSPTKQSTEDFKTKILNDTNECIWHHSSYVADSIKYTYLVDSANSKYDIETITFITIINTTYKFTKDSIYMEYRRTNDGFGYRCGLFTINNGDTIAADTITCIQSFYITPAFTKILKKGIWDCNNNTLYFYFTMIAECNLCAATPDSIPDYITTDTTEQFLYHFSNDNDTMYIGKDSTFLLFTKE